MKKTLNLIALIGSNRKVVEKEIEKHGYILEDYGNYGEYSYGVYKFFAGTRKLNFKFKVVGDNEFAETIIII